METGNGVGGWAQGVPGAMREKGPEWSLGLGTGARKPGMREGRLSILTYTGTVSLLPSEFSNALEYLKLLNSFVDSVGIVTPPFSSSSVLKSALGKRPRVGSAGSCCQIPSFPARWSQGLWGSYECVLESLLCF